MNSHVSHGVLKQHQVHGGVDLVVSVHRFQQSFVESNQGLDSAVPGLLQPASKMAVQVQLLGLLQNFVAVLGRTQTEHGEQRRRCILLCTITTKLQHLGHELIPKFIVTARVAIIKVPKSLVFKSVFGPFEQNMQSLNGC